MKECKLINLASFGDERGKISILEYEQTLPFVPKRIFYTYDVPTNQTRGNHANINTKFVMVALTGSVTIEVDNGKERSSFTLDKPTTGLFIDSNTWKTMKNFSKGAILLIIANTKYDEKEYITNYDDFLKEINR